jgi:hypothetical protein
VLRRQLATVLLIHALLTAPLARADDWLAVWPACSIDDASRPTLSLLYPAPGLPAVVHAGEPLIARLRTPSALTPPPGVQQERVLERWTVELRSSALHVGVDAKERHRHILPVNSIRPDGGDSLVYRVRIEIPAYVAPGTYAFALQTPFGTRSAEQAVSVLGPGATPRLVRLPPGMLLPPPAAGTWPADVWLAGAAAEAEAREGDRAVSAAVDPEPGSSEAEPTRGVSSAEELTSAMSDTAPTLLAEGSSVALRVGSELLVRNGCSDDAAFEREVAAVLVTEHLTRTPFDTRLAGSPPVAANLTSAVLVQVQPDGASIDNTTGRTSRELSLLLPFGSGATADEGTLALYPATEPNARQPLAKLARWTVPANVRASIQLSPARGSSPLALSPHTARSGQPAHVRVIGADARAKVAYTLGFARSAYASPDLVTSFSGPLSHPVRAQVFEADGVGQVVHGHLWVEPHRPPNCAIRPRGHETSPAPGLFLALLGLTLLVRRYGFAKKAPSGGPVE